MPPPRPTTTEWRKICAEAGRKPEAEAEAREMLAVILDEYPALAYDPERERERRQRAERMLEHLAAFERDYRAEFAPADDAVRTTDVMIRIKPDLWCLEGLRRRADAALRVARARQRHRNTQYSMLYFRLCELWLDYFQGGLQLPVRPELPPPSRFCTPLVKFILAAMRLVVPPSELPQPETVRDAIEAERHERAHFKQELRQHRLRRERERG